MGNAVWLNAIKNTADPKRAEGYLSQLKATPARAALNKASAEQARVLTALFSGSQALSEVLIANPDWVKRIWDIELLQHARQKQGLQREIKTALRPLMEARDYAAAYRVLREFKQREMLRIAARDLARLAQAPDITLEISNVADICLDAVFQLAYRQLTERMGKPYHQDVNHRWLPTEFCVLGMGKLGGQELNYSSDVDVIFVYSEEGHTFKAPPASEGESGHGLTNHQFFTRLAEEIVKEIGRMTPEGMLFRIDLRLRPEGNDGPLVRSLASFENFYAQWGQTWERMMLIKARGVAGDASLAAEFLETVQPFRYPRALGERILREVAAMKQRTEEEVVKSGELQRNVKLGYGGIREIEFVVQTLQLLNAGRVPFLQSAQTLPTLAKLVQYNLLTKADAETLSEAYCFLRDVEHRLQMENNLQTHTIPTERKARDRLAALMGFRSLAAFEAAHKKHTRQVREIYDKFLKITAPPSDRTLPARFEGHEAEWKALLAAHSFKNVDKSYQLVRALVEGPGYMHVSPRTVDLARQLLPRMLALCPRANRPPKPGGTGHQILSDPDRVLARLDTFVAAYGARSMMYETWASNPSLFDMLVVLFDRSEFLAETAIRTPDLVDELALSGRLRRPKTAPETLKDLRYGLADPDQHLWLRRYHQAEFMRIGLRDILGLADFEQNLVELSALADACLQYALEVTLRKHQLARPPFVVIGLGKLGGSELNYGSDLDILFVAGGNQKNLPKLQGLAVEIMDLLSSHHELGVVFPTDARLRPDGEKGLLVNTLEAYEDYYRRRAQLWELQAISRTRPVAGDEKIGAQFQQLAATLTDFRNPSQPLAGWRPDWLAEIARMRARIEKERTPSGKNDLAIKTGTGGLIDAEFIAQALCLTNGWNEPNTLRALERARDANCLPADDAAPLIENFRKLRRVEGILRRWSYAGETVLPDDPAPLYRVAIRCGFKDADEFMQAVGQYRAAIRKVYSKVMQPA